MVEGKQVDVGVWLLILVFVTSLIPTSFRDTEMSLYFTIAVGLLYVLSTMFLPIKGREERVLIFLIVLASGLVYICYFEPFPIHDIWLVYNLIALLGLTVLFIFHRYYFKLSEIVTWLFAVFYTLNFVSGTWSVYFDFPFWDIFTHIVGTFLIALVMYRIIRWWSPDKLFVFWMALSVTTFFGSLIEMLEWSSSQYITIDRTLTYADAITDMFYNLMGAGAGAWVGFKLDDREGVVGRLRTKKTT